MAKDKNSVGRPTVLTAKVVSKLEDALRFGASVTEACYLSGISRDTFYQHFRTDQAFSDKIERARSWLSVQAKHNLAMAIMNGDIKSSVWLLEKRDSLPTASVQEEIPLTQDEEWDEGDMEMLENYLKTQKQLKKQHENTALNP